MLLWHKYGSCSKPQKRKQSRSLKTENVHEPNIYAPAIANMSPAGPTRADSSMIRHQVRWI